MTAHQIHYPFIREATLSPDGSQVVYTVEEAWLTDMNRQIFIHNVSWKKQKTLWVPVGIRMPSLPQTYSKQI
ncbi:hypothetical protein KFU94_52425 [Chloroflexi bacterium TSY]|nr:hypothetical protein [Chloroflexi bacterium TSY]